MDLWADVAPWCYFVDGLDGMNASELGELKSNDANNDVRGSNCGFLRWRY